MSDVTAAGRELLGAMKILRDKIARVRANDDLFDRAQALKGAIDDMAEGITGRRDHFWTQPHSLNQAPK